MDEINFKRKAIEQELKEIETKNAINEQKKNFVVNMRMRKTNRINNGVNGVKKVSRRLGIGAAGATTTTGTKASSSAWGRNLTWQLMMRRKKMKSATPIIPTPVTSTNNSTAATTVVVVVIVVIRRSNIVMPRAWT